MGELAPMSTRPRARPAGRRASGERGNGPADLASRSSRASSAWAIAAWAGVRRRAPTSSGPRTAGPTVSAARASSAAWSSRSAGKILTMYQSSVRSSSPLARPQLLGLLGLTGPEQQLRQVLHRGQGSRVALDQLLQRTSLPFRVAGAVGEPDAEGEHLGRRDAVGGQMLQGAAHLGLDLRRPGPSRVEASRRPDRRAGGGGSVEPPACLLEMALSRRQARPAQPDPVVVGSGLGGRLRGSAWPARSGWAWSCRAGPAPGWFRPGRSGPSPRGRGDGPRRIGPGACTGEQASRGPPCRTRLDRSRARRSSGSATENRWLFRDLASPHHGGTRGVTESRAELSPTPPRHGRDVRGPARKAQGRRAPRRHGASGRPAGVSRGRAEAGLPVATSRRACRQSACSRQESNAQSPPQAASSPIDQTAIADALDPPTPRKAEATPALVASGVAEVASRSVSDRPTGLTKPARGRSIAPVNRHRR